MAETARQWLAAAWRLRAYVFVLGLALAGTHVYFHSSLDEDDANASTYIPADVIEEPVDNVALDALYGLLAEVSVPCTRSVQGKCTTVLPMPLEGVNVTASMTDLVAEVEVRQVYRNRGMLALQAQYLFPVDEKAAIFSFEAQIGSRQLKTKVEKSEVARKEYEEAVSQGRMAALLEEKKADVFQVHVGNIPPGETAVITLKYVAELPVGATGLGTDKSPTTVVFTLPTTVAPRYVPSKAMAAAASKAGFGVTLSGAADYSLNVLLTAAMTSPIWRVTSPSHKENLRSLLSPTQGRCDFLQFRSTLASPGGAGQHQPGSGEVAETRRALNQKHGTDNEAWVADSGTVSEASWSCARVTLERVTMNKDVTVHIQLTEPHSPSVVVEFQNQGGMVSKPEGHTGGSQTGNGTVAAMFSFVPRFELDEQKVEVLFVVDRSGSMHGDKIQNSADALQLLLHSLPLGSYFNILGFGSYFEALFENGSLPLDDETLTRASTYASQLSGNFGGTEMLRALQFVLSLPVKPGYLRQVFVLTDGEVWNLEEIFRAVRDHAGALRVFTLGIGASVSRELVSGLARAGGGTAEFVGEGERMQPKVLRQMKRALQPSLTDVSIQWEMQDGKSRLQQGGRSSGADEDEAKRPIKMEKTLLGYRKPKDISKKEQAALEEERGIARLVDGKGSLHAPLVVRPLFDGEAFWAYLLLGPGESLPRAVTITGRSPDGPLSLRVEVSRKDWVQGGTVHRLAARAIIRDLEEGARKVGTEEDEEAEKDLVAALGLAYSLASRETSFIAVDESGKRVDTLGRRVHAVVPSLAEAGGGFHMMQSFSLGGDVMENSHMILSRQAVATSMAMPAVRVSTMAMRRAAASNVALPVMSSFRGKAPGGSLHLQRFGASNKTQSAEETSNEGEEPVATGHGTIAAAKQEQVQDFKPEPEHQKQLEDGGSSGPPSGTALVQQLVVHQRADGSFPMTRDLLSVLGLQSKTDVELEEAMGKLIRNKDCWATVLVMQALKTRAAKEAAEWELLVKKAMKFIKSKGLEDVDELMNAAKLFL